MLTVLETADLGLNHKTGQGMVRQWWNKDHVVVLQVIISVFPPSVVIWRGFRILSSPMTLCYHMVIPIMQPNSLALQGQRTDIQTSFSQKALGMWVFCPACLTPCSSRRISCNIILIYEAEQSDGMGFFLSRDADRKKKDKLVALMD